MRAGWIGIWFCLLFSLESSPIQELDRYIESSREAWGVPGVAVGIVQEGEIQLLKGYGSKQSARMDPVGPDTQFPIGSITKPMIAEVLHELVKENRLEWQDRVGRYLPHLQLQDLFSNHNLRIQDLVTHRIGLPNHAGDLLYLTQSEGHRLERVYHIPPVAPFRHSFSYQNLSYLALGELIETVTGSHWSKELRARLFAPLAMHRTHGRFQALPIAHDVSFPHAVIDEKRQRLDWSDSIDFGAAGSVVSTAREMLRWVQSVMHQKELIRPKIFLKEDPVRRMLYPTSKWAGYGLGWYVQEYYQRHLVDHNGNVPGFTAKVGWIPEEEIGVVILCNDERSMLPHALMMRTMETLLYLPRRDWSASLLQVTKNSDQWARQQRGRNLLSRKKNAPPTFSPVGRFTHPLYGQAKISNGRIKIGPVLEGKLEHWHYNTYRIRWKSKLGKLYPGSIRATFALDAFAQIARMDVERMGVFALDQAVPLR